MKDGFVRVGCASFPIQLGQIKDRWRTRRVRHRLQAGGPRGPAAHRRNLRS